MAAAWAYRLLSKPFLTSKLGANRVRTRHVEPMKLPDLVEQKLRDPEAIVLPRTAPVRRGKMVIHYHCEGKPIGESSFQYSPAAYADWLRSMAENLSMAAAANKQK